MPLGLTLMFLNFLMFLKYPTSHITHLISHILYHPLRQAQCATYGVQQNLSIFLYYNNFTPTGCYRHTFYLYQFTGFTSFNLRLIETETKYITLLFLFILNTGQSTFFKTDPLRNGIQIFAFGQLNRFVIYLPFVFKVYGVKGLVSY